MSDQGMGRDQVLRELMACQQRVNELAKLKGKQERELLQARASLATVFESAPDALIVVDSQGRITQVNAQAETLFGYRREELIGKDHGVLVPDQVRERHADEMRSYMDKPRLRTMGIGLELYGRRKDGSVFSADIDLGPLEQAEGLFVLGVVRDVTVRKILEEDLSKSEKRYRDLVELSPDAIVVHSEERIIFINAAGAGLFGAGSAEKVVGRQLKEFVRHDYPEMMRELLLEERKITPAIEVRVLRQDGSVAYGEVLSMPVAFQERQAVLSIIRDITERKHAEEAQKELQERYRRTLDNMMEGCQMIDFDWRYLYLNNAAAIHGRRPKEDLLGRTMVEMYPGIENTEFFVRLRECMEKRTPIRMENEFIFPDGSKGWFELSIQPIPEGVFILSMDITERKRLEEELSGYRRRLEEVVAERTAEFAQANAKLRQAMEEHRKTEEGLLLRATILDNAGDPIFVFNQKFDFVYANEASCRAYGYTYEEFLTMNLRNLLPPQDAPLVESRLKEVMGTGRLELSTVHIRKDQSRMPVQVRHTRIKTLHGQFIVSVMHDIRGQ